MATSAKKITNKRDEIQSKAQKVLNEQKEKVASTTEATNSGSTETPVVTDTPKVTPTAKAMPTRNVTPVSQATINATPVTTPTNSVSLGASKAMDLLSTKTTPTLKKAVTPDLLSKETEKKDIESTTIPLNIVRTSIKVGGQVAKTVADSLYQQGLDWINDKFNKLEETREKVTETVGRTTVDLFKGVGQDISTQWEEGKGLGATKDAILNTVQGLPRGIARIEYGLSELLDWGVDAQWATDLKNSIKKDLDYWEGTRTYQKIKETDSFSDFLKNPFMYAGGTLGEMLPMFINAWVAVPTTFAQIYGETYSDYAQDESLSDLSDNQIRLISTGVAGVNTLIELASDLVEGIMPWTKPAAKATEKEIRKSLSKPFSNLIKKFLKGGASEGVEEVLQNEIQDQVAGFAGSDRELPTWGSRFTTFGISSIIGTILQGGNIVIDINKHKELESAFNEWSEAVDKIAPGVSKEDKEKLFSAIVAAEIQDAQMDEDLVNKYESQTTELYKRIDELNKELENTTDENKKTEINRQIEDANQKINDIDEIINSANKITEEVNTKLQELSNQKEIEEIYESANKQSYREEGLENLSEQTMRDISYHLPSTGKDYESFAEALKQPQNDILKKLPISDLMKIEDGATRMRASATPELVKSLDFVRAAVQKELEERYNKDKKPEETKPAETIEEPSTFKDAEDYIQKMLDYEEKKVGHKLSDGEKNRLRKKYSRNFLRKNLEGDFSRHMVGLKGVNLKQIEGELTDERLANIANMLALISDTFGIDFNKLITDKNLSLNIAQNIGEYLESYGTIGIMLPKHKKDKLREFLLSKGFSASIADIRGEDLATIGVAISLKDGDQRAGETMAHELWHFIDYAISLEEGLPLRLVKDSSGSHIDYTSIIAKQRGWRTFNLWNVRKGTKNYDYLNDPSEILARYAEQYFAYIHDNESFKELAYTKEGYWTPEEFEKLLPKFESLIKDRVGGKLLDKGNEFYYDVMNRIRDNKFARISEEFDRGGLFKTDVKQRIEFMKEEYAFIMSHINEMTGTLKEEMETYVQLSNIQTNYEMAVAKGEEYLEKIRTTPEQQGTIDGVTTTVLPPEPEPGNANPTPPQNPETIENGLPQLGGSNIENGIGDLSEGGNGEQLGSSYMEENTRIKIRKRKNRIKNFRKELGQAWKDVFTPTISRIYNISPRIAGRLITMETQKDINIHRYRQKAKGFVETLGKLKGKQALEVKMALLDYGALASEQGENIEQYKEEEVAKLKEVLLRNGFKEQDINDMFSVLDDIGQQYKDAGLSVTLTDMYFPRVVKDYEGLIDYMNRVSGNSIKVNKASLLLRIKQIQNDPNLSDEEKEKRIRHIISTEFKQPGTTSQHGKERKMGKLSDWGEGIFAYYESPIESIDHYIVTMTNAIQRQLFLGGLKEDANTDADIINQDTTESVSQIIGKLVEDGMINEEDVEELQKSILAVLNKKPSPKSVTALKDITYIATITNFLSAINQLDDLGMVILKDRSGLKHIVKAIFGRANIKYNDLGLEDSYEMFREEGGITNWLFKKSLFNFFDRLGKTSFINAAWESMVRQSKNEKTRQYLYTRLVSMYGQESADRMMEKIDSGNYMGDDGQIDIEILRDLLYQLGSTQPIYTSAMSTTYLNHPWARLCYALSSFTLKRIDWLVQGAKEVNAQHGAVAAGAWVMGVSAFLAMFGAAIGDVGDLLKGKKEETFLWQLINNGIEDALKSGGSDALNSWLKIWDLSDYDIKLYKQQGLWGVFSSKIKPFIFDLGKDITEAITEHDTDEITDLAKYVPIFGKLVYYWCFEDIGKETKKNDWDFDMDTDWDFGVLTDTWDWEDDEERDFS